MKQTIAYVVCFNSNEFSVNVVDADISKGGVAIQGYQREYFYIDKYDRDYVNLVKTVLDMIRKSDIIYADTSKSKAMTTRLIALTPIVHLQKNENRHYSVEVTSEDWMIEHIIESTIVYRDDMTEVEYLSMLVDANTAVVKCASYQSNLLNILVQAMNNK